MVIILVIIIANISSLVILVKLPNPILRLVFDFSLPNPLLRNNKFSVLQLVCYFSMIIVAHVGHRLGCRLG